MMGSVLGSEGTSQATGQPRKGRAPSRWTHRLPCACPSCRQWTHAALSGRLCASWPSQTTLGGPEGWGQEGQGQGKAFSEAVGFQQTSRLPLLRTLQLPGPTPFQSLFSPLSWEGQCQTCHLPFAAVPGKVQRPRTIYREVIQMNDYFLSGCLWVLQGEKQNQEGMWGGRRGTQREGDIFKKLAHLTVGTGKSESRRGCWKFR